MRVLLLGGTGEARQLADIVTAERGFEVVSSLAGRVREPVLPAGAVRVGGFGGVDGLREWLADNAIDVVIDATHPFADTMSAHAAAAARAAGVPILHLRRPGWAEQPGDRWLRVPDPAAAVRAVAGFERVFLTIGRQGVAAFAELAVPWFLIRAIDPPTGPVPPRHRLLLARGPFTVAEETDLMREHRIEVVVTKDSGGESTAAKLTAARDRHIPVVVIDRPELPAGGDRVDSVAAAWEWLLRNR
ncbi:cobalt-precorrin-6A reductase [Nocardia veterana]|uniref:Cobalt-precorrin-6A reductase n=1 Tax=Nocardia veterana TaxID=132249 RepID=A0A7X6RJB5_9NOCA|nr:cobalt-precorrin-6A reductase [Nocardia veterana]NKY88087.1 cobalt-precorrin-6A reductase [Nocardia veterana]